MPVVEIHPASGSGLLPEERIAIQEVSPRDAVDALLRGHHTRVMTHPVAPPPKRPKRGRKPRVGSRGRQAKAGKKGGSRVRKLIEEGHKYEEEHGTRSARKGRGTKTAAKRRAPKAASKRAAPAAKGRRGKSTRKAR